MAVPQVAMQGKRGLTNLVTELEYFALSFHILRLLRLFAAIWFIF
jgi:hypothetical protein